MTEAEVLEAVRAGARLSRIPEALRTPAVCLEAVRRDDTELEHVPEPVRTPDLCA